MSDTIGVIGQKYEDRKSKRVGTLLDRDAENKKLSFIDESGESFQVSFAAFKSNWRKVITAEPANDAVEWPADEPEESSSCENVEKAEPDIQPEVKPLSEADFANEDDKIKDFVKALTEARVASVDIVGDTTSVMADDVVICTLDKVADGYKVFMLPDIFIFTEWNNTFNTGDVHFNIKPGRHSGVLIDCVRATLGDILQFIKTAAVEINLYGYID
jgi:hypothetical protein